MHSQPASRFSWIAVAALCSIAAQSPAHAQGTDETRAAAKNLFEQGVANYDAGHYEQALANFQEAFRLRPHPLVNVNIANCYDKLGKPLQALFHFERFLESDAGTAAQREEVTSAVERLKQQLGKLFLRITPDGALVVIDQGEQRRAPILEGIPLEAGKHTVEVKLPGYKSVQRTVTLRGGSTLELNIALEPENAAAATAAPAPKLKPLPSPLPEGEAGPAQPAPLPAEVPAPQAAKPASSSGGVPSGAWVLGGLTLALGGAATVTGVLALQANSDFDHYKTERFSQTATSLQRVAAYNKARNAADRANALALTTDILLGGVVVGAAITIYLIASAPGDEAAPKPQHARLTPWLGPRAVGAGIDGRF